MCEEIAVGQARRLLQHRAGHRDIVVLGEAAHQPQRRVADRRQPVGQFRPRLGLDLVDQAAEDVVEQVDVIFIELAGAVQEQVGDLLQRLGPAFRGAALDDVFQFRDQRRSGHLNLESTQHTTS